MSNITIAILSLKASLEDDALLETNQLIEIGLPSKVFQKVTSVLLSGLLDKDMIGLGCKFKEIK